jgi:MFS transporter, DHA1 family, multidrug resistance protein
MRLNPQYSSGIAAIFFVINPVTTWCNNGAMQHVSAVTPLQSLNPAMPIGLVVLLGVLLFMPQPLGTDLYLPSMAAIAQDFGLSVAQVGRTMTAFLIGFGIAQLLCGPLCDRFGRRTLALWGVALYTMASAACALAPTIDWLVAMRVVQAAGACATFIAARALVRDCVAPQEGARVISTISSYMVVAPVGGILLGGALVSYLGWRFNFAALTLFGAAVFAVLWLRMAETLKPSDMQRINVRGLWQGYRIICANPSFLAFTAVACAGGAGLFTHLSASSLVYVKVLHETPLWFSVCFAFNCFGFLSGTVLLRHWLPRIGAVRLLMRAGAIQVLSIALSIAIAYSGFVHWSAIAVCNFFFLVGYGLLMSVCQAGSVAPFPERAGTAGSLMGSLQVGCGAVAGWWMGVAFDGTVFPLLLTQLCTGAAVLVFAATLVRKYGTF